MRTLYKYFVCVLLFFVVPVYSFASTSQNKLDDWVTIGAYKRASFNPTRNEKFTIPLKITQHKKIKKLDIELRTHDDDLIRRLKITEFDAKKTDYEVIWDGKDSQNQLVPNEAYYPILVITDKKNNITRIDPRTDSGGEEVYDFDKKVAAKAIEYTLPVASRMLIRSGIKNGPMLRTVIDWEPRAAGFNIERWSGRDADNVIAIDQTPQVAYLIIGYQLPDHSIITYGNSKETYRVYRERQKWPIKKANYENRLLERNKKLVRAEYYTPVLQQKSPRIEVKMLDKQSRKPVKEISQFEEIFTEVKLHPLDEIYLDQERYEISFFIDNQFIAEEEQGFVPFTWRWSPGRYGIKPGEHIFTINVSGYNGQVGVKNIRFTLKEETKNNP